MTSSVFILSIQLYSHKSAINTNRICTEGHAMWFLKCCSMKHLSSACTCSLCLYSFSSWGALAGGYRIRSHPDHLVKKKTQMMTNEHGTEIVSSCPSKTDLPNICTSLVHKLACIYIENPGRFNLLFKVDQLLSIISRDCYCVTYLSFLTMGCL